MQESTTLSKPATPTANRAITDLPRAAAVALPAWWTEVAGIGLIAGQLALLTLLSHGFEIETFAFRKVMALSLAGFVVHHLLPMRLRLPFFVVLSFAALVMVVWPANALRLVGVGAALIALCHLPIAFAARLALIAVAGTALILGRANWFSMPGYEAIWPILGSMFMFRLMVYLYDLKNQSAPFSLWRSLAYFFMIPNVCFPMYPIVDYQTFNRTYYNEASPWRMYQVGIKWILRGIVHLLLYRLVTQNLLIGADYVNDAGDLVRYMVTTFLLYLQISGQFHVIVGLLHLFGFNLPETHHNYLLSSSFTDFWRRINIYWKDFILKVFFNPVYFRIKHWGPFKATIVATLVAFFFTWLLHSYQWFWIRGTFFVSWQDSWFWGLLALFVLVNALYELRYGRSRLVKGKGRSLVSRVGLGLRTVGTFTVIVTLWCMWTFQGTAAEWFAFMSNITRIDAPTALWIALGAIGLGVAGALWGDAAREYSAGQKGKLGKAKAEVKFDIWQSAALTSVVILAIPGVVKYRDSLPLGPTITSALGEVRRAQSLLARAERDQGYYEDLTNTRTYNLALWELYNHRPTGWVMQISHTEAALPLPDKFHCLELAPSKKVEFAGATVSTNRWGMRDREYEKAKPDGTFRAAVLGSSISMGWGVDDNETYENILEDRLNHDHSSSSQRHFEILNFGVPGYADFQKLHAFERALEFDPDVIFWEIHSTSFTWMVNHLWQVVQNETPIPYPELRERLKAAGIVPGASGLKARPKLREMAPELLMWIWQRMQKECDERGIKLQVVVLPRADHMAIDRANLKEMADLARKSGLPVLDLSAAYHEATKRADVAVAAGDAHPNDYGHRLLAKELYRQMLMLPYWRVLLNAEEPAAAASTPVAPVAEATSPGGVSPSTSKE